MQLENERKSLQLFNKETISKIDVGGSVKIDNSSKITLSEEDLVVGDGDALTLLEIDWRMQRVVVRTRVSIGCQRVLQVSRLISKERRHVVCLTNKGLRLYSLPDLHLKSEAEDTAGATFFSQAGAGYLAVVMKKRVVIFRLEGINLCREREIHFPCQITHCVVLLNSSIYAASQDGQVFFSPQSEAKTVDACQDARIVTNVDRQTKWTSASPVRLRNHSFVTLLTDMKGSSYLFDKKGDFYRANKLPAFIMENCPSRVFWPLCAAEGENASIVQMHLCCSACRIFDRIELQGDLLEIFMPESLDILFLVDSSGALTAVRRFSIEKIVDQLLKEDLFDSALCFARELNSEDQECRIRYSYGKYLLQNAQYEDGMHNISMGAKDPIEVLLFLDFLLPQSLKEEGRHLLRDKLGYGDEIDSLGIVKRSENELQGLAGIILPYLWSYRSRLLSKNNKSLSVQTRLVDSAILNLMMLLPDDGSILRFLQGKNYVDYETSKSSLQSSGRYKELVTLYKNNGHHSTALDLLRRLSVEPENFDIHPQGISMDLKGLPGVWATVKYLTSIKHSDMSLIRYHSKWIVQLDPDAAVELFVGLYPGVEPSIAMSILPQAGLQYSADYLERIREEMKEESAMYDQILAETYLKYLISEDSKKSEETHNKILRIFNSLVFQGNGIEVQRLMSILPPTGSWEVRATLLEKSELYKEVLDVHLNYIGDLRAVEEFCNRIEKRSKPMEKSIYVQMLELSFAGDEDLKISRQKILSIVGRHMVPSFSSEAINAVPTKASLSEVIHLLEAAIWSSGEAARRIVLRRSLAQGKLLDLRAIKATLELSFDVIGTENVCSMCKRKVGTTAIVRLTGGVLVHYSCYNKLKYKTRTDK